jgi:hypothetical protein
MNGSGHGPVGRVTAFLQGSSAAFRVVAEGEWGVLLDDVGGRPLEVGLRVSDGLLRAQAWVAPAGLVDAHVLLHRNRLRTVARYAHSSGGDVWVHGEIPVRAVCDPELDRLLGALVEAAAVVRSG